MESRGGKIINSSNKIRKSLTELIVEDMNKEIRENPNNAFEILTKYYWGGFVGTILDNEEER